MLTVRESADKEMSRDLFLPSSLSDQSAASHIYMYKHENHTSTCTNMRLGLTQEQIEEAL